MTVTFEQLFDSSNNSKRTVFLPYVCCGDPNITFTKKLIHTLVKNGADGLELGIPFSDPIADGKTIQAASNRALKNGTNTKMAFDLIADLRKEGITIPIAIMTYYNIIYSQCVENFVALAKKAGANGFVVPDVPVEESGPLYNSCTANGLSLISLVTPQTTSDRLKLILQKASGFVYLVSVAGTTGSRDGISSAALFALKEIPRYTNLPVVVGFGISKPEHAKAYSDAGARGVIVGSEIVNIYSKYLRVKEDGTGAFVDSGEEKALEEVGEFTRKVKLAMQKSYKPL
ncbi:tryptophan synthase subunit alpha [Candidatus Micrarchaeota archaeon]|nr:tryptophan synthase subunit alpha [Candidatus Micrarchaeota archaeon]